MTTSRAYQIYSEPITLFLDTHGQATPGLLQYHISGKQADIDQCLAEMQVAGQVEPCGVELHSPAYLGQPLYCLKKAPYWRERALIELALDHANEELLGLHHYGVLSYQQYSDVANLLIDARERLQRYIRELTQ